MTKKFTSFFLVMTLLVVAIPALATDAGETPAGGLSPSLSVALNNLNHVAGTVSNPTMSPTMSMALDNLNQVGATQNQPLSPSLSNTLKSLNQVSGSTAGVALSPGLSLTLKTLNRYTAIQDYGVPIAGLFTMKDMLTEDARSAFDTIASYVKKGHAVYGYFGVDIPGLAQSGNLSPDYADFDFSKLILSEYVSLAINKQQALDVGVTTTFGFASEYEPGQTVVVMFGFRNQRGDIVWHALNTVAVNGQVKVDFPPELLQQAGSEAILGVLS